MIAFFDISPFSWENVVLCSICGWLLGLERQLRGKPVGIRTATLIIVGTYIFMTLAMSISSNQPDHARVLGQIVTGIGFLGAGVMMSRDGQIHGVTSASVIWLMAGLGGTIAFGHGKAALILCGFVLFVLVGIDKIESTFTTLTKGVHRQINFHYKTKKSKRIKKLDLEKSVDKKESSV